MAAAIALSIYLQFSNHLVLQNATVDPGGLNLLMQFTFDGGG